MDVKQTIDSASDLGTIVSTLGYARDFGKWYYNIMAKEFAAFESHLTEYRDLLKKI